MENENQPREYWAHSYNDSGNPHLLRAHLEGVGELAARFAAEMNLEVVEAARWAGLLHDLGKYRDEFQSYLRKERESSIETHHAVYGAALAHLFRKWLGPAFVIAGHHAGLHDQHLLKDLVCDEKYDANNRVPEILARFERELGPIPEKIKEPGFSRLSKTSAEFYIRMLFSALVDADFLDTEAHYKETKRSPLALDPGELLARLQAEKESKPTDGDLNGIRHRIFEQCLEAALQDPGFFSLTVPTGGGKTLSGMAFALAHAQCHGLRRIIVVIPYLSIIEQNAAQYRRILDPQRRGIVVEHHSAVPAPVDDEGRRRSQLEYAAENWDAPIIVTTSVQLIESLFANRTSRCRKLHNIARSVIIFDEAQTLPSHLLTPLLSVFRELKTNYGVSIVFSTATQPAFRQTMSLKEGFVPQEVREITQGTSATFERLQRVRYRLPKQGETLNLRAIAEQMAERRQAMCVVNTRRQAGELWEELRNLLTEEGYESLFHLSSAMCAQHRFDLLGEDGEAARGTIRARLRNAEPCLVVSTQLIEAGVDVDFPVVWRALAPLDSIVQAGGRCNREGRLTDSKGRAALGEVIVFEPEEHRLPPGIYKTATDITAKLLAGRDADAIATSHEIFGEYFTQLYQYSPTDLSREGECSIQVDREHLRFREVARKARVIADDTRPVIVPYGGGRDIVTEIRERTTGKGQPRIDKGDLQRLQRYMVNLHSNDFKQLQALQQIQPLLKNLELYVLSDGFYHRDLGLVINQRPAEDYFL
ncbi:MAG: CRISPR-associated helicase Cas3' [Acidobacteria bacterium]|nr:CRISPR-associated helicase Cas3' [Acidobacteriota bacterium]